MMGTCHGGGTGVDAESDVGGRGCHGDGDGISRWIKSPECGGGVRVVLFEAVCLCDMFPIHGRDVKWQGERQRDSAVQVLAQMAVVVVRFVVE